METQEKVMQMPPAIMARNAGTVSNFRIGQVSEAGPRGGSCRVIIAITGRRPTAAITKSAACQP